jgi:hypothetical protein
VTAALYSSRRHGISRLTRGTAATPKHAATKAGLNQHKRISHKIPHILEANHRPYHVGDPLTFVAVWKNFGVCFVQLTKIFIEPVFRLGS